MFLKFLTVTGLATFEIYAAIPAGFAFGLSSWTIFFASVIGGLVSVFVAAFLGERFRQLFRKNKPVKQHKSKPSMVHRLWDKYGIIGLGFFGTITMGASITIAAGVGFNANLKKLLTWCCAGVVTRCTLFTLVAYYGLKLF